MSDHAIISRVHRETSAIARQNALIRALVARTIEVLNAPMPDTFLGRRTQEPFPKESDIRNRRQGFSLRRHDDAG